MNKYVEQLFEKRYRVWWEWEKAIVVREQFKVNTKNLEKVWFLKT